MAPALSRRPCHGTAKPMSRKVAALSMKVM
jgi:hypothetical protein